ncbi:hypothetical protein [Leifsonia xyli]|uniref:hypothetical protein n=1 Tax=Leifsonia xyli TaxID=1575 RepID=UPI003D67AD21
METSGGHRHVIMDTNAFGAGKCSPRDLENVRKLTDAGAKVIVPDVVVRELSAHVGNEIAKVNRASLSLVVGDEATRQLEQWQDSHHAFGQLSTHLEQAGAVVVTTPTRWWEQGVLDQINSNPPAERKGEVTTGAVDAIIARHAQNGFRKYGETLVITNDRALTNHLETVGVAVTRTVQDAVGMVANNASADEVRALGRAIIFDPEWRKAFVALLPRRLFNTDSLATVDVLGVSNMSRTIAGLVATVAWAIDHIVERPTLSGEDDDDAYYAGTEIFTADAVLDPGNFRPEQILTLSDIENVSDYANYPNPLGTIEYIALERVCLPSPQAEASFVVTRSPDSPDTSEIHGMLGDLLAARVRLSLYDVDFVDRDFGDYTVQYTDLSVGGPVSVVPAKRPPTFGGYVGARMFTLWVGGEVSVK